MPTWRRNLRASRGRWDDRVGRTCGGFEDIDTGPRLESDALCHGLLESEFVADFAPWDHRVRVTSMPGQAFGHELALLVRDGSSEAAGWIRRAAGR